MDYTLTTIHDAEIELTRLLYMEPTVVESIKALGQEAHDLWAQTSHPYRRLSGTNAYSDRDYRHWWHRYRNTTNKTSCWRYLR